MKKNKIIVSDTGAVISLAIIKKLNLLTDLFDEVYIPYAVWEELFRKNNLIDSKIIKDFFTNRIKKISGFNEFILFMDYGESEAILLYQELNADYLIIIKSKRKKLLKLFFNFYQGSYVKIV